MRLDQFLVLATLAGCGFSVNGAGADAGSGSGSTIDAAIDARPLTCTPGEHACDGRDRLTCGADSTWDTSQTSACDYTCAAGACVTASNVPIDAVMACSSSAPKLTPAAGTTLTLSASGGTHIDCAPNCGDPSVTKIDMAGSVTGSPGLAYFCFSSVSIPSGVTLTRSASGGPAAAIAWIVDGDVTIAGDVDFNGGAGAASTTEGNGGGVGAPGGYDGAGLSSGSGRTGDGPCAGDGGDNDGSSDHWVGGGGAGGGGATAGGGGGGGKCSHGDHSADGGGPSAVCGVATLIPLLGGSGGGAGGDGTTGVQQGWAAGGGGGALQISSRTRITVSGGLHAAGGNGYGNSAFDGGGGGGAGGALLLEAPTLSLTGALSVDGGTGGKGGAGPGGAGATGASGPQPGLSHAANGQSGSGGGGAGGHIRVNGVNAACTATASPAASCTAGVLVPQ